MISNTKNSIPILMYHSIDASGSVISLTKEVFAHHLQYLQDHKFAVISLSEAFNLLKQNLPTDKKVVITFDDGFENFYTEALPLLTDHHMPATVFLVSDYCAKNNRWPGQGDNVPTLPLMNWQQIRVAATTGITFGAHTLSHPDLTRLSLAEIAREVVDSRNKIEDQLGQPIDSFAYPYGISDLKTREIVAHNFHGAVGTYLAKANSSDDIYNLSRIDIYYLKDNIALLDSPLLSLYLQLRNSARRVRQKFINYSLA